MKRIVGIVVAMLLIVGIKVNAQTFYDAGYVYRVIGDGEAEVEGYSGASESIIIPVVATYGRQTLKVTSVGFKAFAGGKMRSVTITRTITQIGANAFQGCKELSKVVIEGTALKTIGYEAFEGCQSLKEIKIPDNVVSISARAFAGSPASKHVKGYNDETGMSKQAEVKAWTDYGYADGFFYMNGMRFRKVTAVAMALDATKAGEKTIVVPSTVTDPEKNVFSITQVDSCDVGVTSLSIPNTVAVFNGRIFSNCKGLKHISFESSEVRPMTISKMAGIGDYRRLRDMSISMPKGLETLYKVSIDALRVMNYEDPQEDGDYTYAKITGTTECALLSYKGPGGKVVIPMMLGGLRITTIENNAFSFDTRLGELTNSMPEQEQKLIEVEIPDGVRYICNEAFNNQTALTQVTIPQSVESIGDMAFYNCVKLQVLSLPNGLIRVGSLAFSHCESVKELNLPESLAYIGNDAFSYCRSAKTLKMPSGLTVLGDGWFDHCEKLESVSLPVGTKEIGLNTFSNCYKLSDIKFPQALVKIGRSTVNLFDEQAKYFGSFSNCRSLKIVDLPSMVEYLGDDAFAGCEKLQKISLPSTLTYLGVRSFNECRSLKEIVIPKNIRQIGGSTKLGTFAGCTGLQQVVFNSDKLESIAAYSFAGCTSLRNVALPNTIQWIDEGAFEGCKSMDMITIPASVHALGYRAFARCTGVKRLVVSDGVGRLSFYDDERQYSRGGAAFAECTNLTDVQLPNTLTLIERSSFEGCTSLSQIVIPGNVAEIEEDAFRGCTKLVDVKVYTSEVTIDEEAKDAIFPECPALKTISTPTGNMNL